MTRADDNDYVEIFSGQKARRCQAHTKRGTRCKAAAVTGYDVCKTHGAGTHKRVKDGSRKPPGRPIIHGLYATRGTQRLSELQQRVLEADIAIDDTSQEINVMRTALLGLYELEPEIQIMRDKLKGIVEGGSSVPEEIIAAAKSLHRLEGYLDRLQFAAGNVIKGVKLTAETKSKTAEAKAYSTYSDMLESTKNIMIDMFGIQDYRTFYARVQREILGPKGVRGDE